MTVETSPHRPPTTGDRRIALVDLLDRVLACGVVVTGEVTLSIADIDLVHISLRPLIRSVRADAPQPTDAEADGKPGGEADGKVRRL
jgi:hypothetical protein